MVLGWSSGAWEAAATAPGETVYVYVLGRGGEWGLLHFLGWPKHPPPPPQRNWFSRALEEPGLGVGVGLGVLSSWDSIVVPWH